jgi:hypothetical protein
MNLNQQTLYDARRALRKAVGDWIYDPNVRLIDFGWRVRGGQLIKDDLSIRIHVIEKFTPGFALEAAIAGGKTRSKIPDEIDGFPVDRPQAIYRLHPFHPTWWRPPAVSRARRHDPMKGGISVSNIFQNIYGTLGGLVADRLTGTRMILSNWHVLAGDWWAQPGRPICQPGVGDGGRQADIVAALSRHAMLSNLDAAVAEISGNRQLSNEQFEIGPVTGVVWALPGMEVVKSGRQSSVTYGAVTAVEGFFRHNYRGIDRIIQNVMTIDPVSSSSMVSAGGDSGAFWLEKSTMRAVGLHFAGSDDPERALAMDMQPVLDALNVDLVV